MKAIRFGTKMAGAFAVGMVVIVAACGGSSSETPTATPTDTTLPTPTATATSTPSATPTPTPSPTIPAENRQPTADFTFEPASVPRGDNNQTVVTLTATASDPDGDPLTFEWTFFSGTPATAEGQVVTTTFPGFAPYPVVLTVSDGRGGTVTVRKTVPLG